MRLSEALAEGRVGVCVERVRACVVLMLLCVADLDESESGWGAV